MTQSIQLQNPWSGTWKTVTNDDLDDEKWEQMAAWMDDEIRERVSDELAPCSKIKFLCRYADYAGIEATSSIYFS
jgi:hypothetical protein